jgi:Protein of unknown function (DUF2924)
MRKFAIEGDRFPRLLKIILSHRIQYHNATPVLPENYCNVLLDCSPLQSVDGYHAGRLLVSRSIAGQIIELQKSSRQALLDAWLRLFGKPAPKGLRRELLIPFLAYRLQENVYGGLKPSTLSALRQIARDLLKSNNSTITRLPKTGTRVIREWRGQVHEVFVTDSGYEYRGAKYRSLSEIARKITGTRWSGPAFFGMKKTGLLNHDG